MNSGAERSWLRRRLWDPVLEQMRQGVTPERMALTVALAAALGLFPILGVTTILCAWVAYALRLNQPVMHVVNYAICPLQVALLLAFYRAGESLFDQPHLDLSVPMLVERFKAGPWQFFADFGRIGLQGVAVWLFVAPLVVVLVYYTARPVLRSVFARLRG